MLKVLHVSFSDSLGGASRAAYRIHRGFLKNGIDSRMLVRKKFLDDPRVLAPLGKWSSRKAGLFAQIDYRLSLLEKDSTPTSHTLGLLPGGLVKHINASGAQLVNLHWLSAGTLSVHEIAKIRLPIVWTLHDMWAFSGSAHYDGDESATPRWAFGYKSNVGALQPKGMDWNRWIFRLKSAAWKKQNFHFISPSRWLGDCVRRSSLFAGSSCHVVPNCVDLDLYRPIPRTIARDLLKLPSDKRLLAFGAMSSTSDPRKGFHLLKAALEQQSGKMRERGCELVVFGSEKAEKGILHGLPVHYLGTIDDEQTLAAVYSAADVFMAPSTQENLPNTVAESLACGTPVVAFNIGGLPDLVQSRQNGYLADPFDPADFANGMLYVLDADPEQMRIRARSLAEDKLAESKVVAQYLDIYSSILDPACDGRLERERSI